MLNHSEELTIVQWYTVDYERMIRTRMQAGMGTMGMEMRCFAGEIDSRGMTDQVEQYGYYDENSHWTIESRGLWHRTIKILR